MVSIDTHGREVHTHYMNEATQTSRHFLFDADTAEKIGPATPEQTEASFAAGYTGIILVDVDGDVVIDGTWSAQQPGVRSVYVR